MTTIPIEDAQTCLLELISRLAPGEEVIITSKNQAVARLTGTRSAQEKTDKKTSLPRCPGVMQGSVIYMAPDFDAPLDDFKDYMP